MVLCVAVGFGVIGFFLGMLLTSLLAVNKDEEE